MRACLKAQGLIHDQKKNLPVYASEEEVQLFEQEGEIASPMLATCDADVIGMEWKLSYKNSNWNTRVLALLTFHFHDLLKNGRVQHCAYQDGKTTFDWVKAKFKKRLDKVKTLTVKDEAALQLHIEQARQYGRCKSRRFSVSFPFFFFDRFATKEWSISVIT